MHRKITHILKFDITIGDRDGKVLKCQIFSKRQAAVGQSDSQSRQGRGTGHADTDVNRDTAILSVILISLFDEAIRVMSMPINVCIYYTLTRMINE